jgi:hypothetical protein
VNTEQLVIRDLAQRESRAFYTGGDAILDAYEAALDTAVYLRQVIEEMTIGDGSLDRKEEPHHRAARTRADDEQTMPDSPQ